MVSVIWDMLLEPAHCIEGLSIIRKIWEDMKGFEGYIQHDILIDDDHPGHIAIVSSWTGRELADYSVAVYADNELVRQLSPMLAGPRKRSVFYKDGAK